MTKLLLCESCGRLTVSGLCGCPAPKRRTVALTAETAEVFDVQNAARRAKPEESQ